MAWSNIAITAKEQPKVDISAIDGPGKATQLASPSGVDIKPLAYETASGNPAADPPGDVVAHRAKQKAAVYRPVVDPNLWQSLWLNSLIRTANQDPAKLMALLVEKLKADPSHDTILNVQSVMNELGRDTESAAAMRSAGINKETILGIIRLSQGVR